VIYWLRMKKKYWFINLSIKICGFLQQSAPCVMFIDEIDAITPKRETASKDMERRIVAQLLACMDGELGSNTAAGWFNYTLLSCLICHPNFDTFLYARSETSDVLWYAVRPFVCSSVRLSVRPLATSCPLNNLKSF